MLAQNAVADPFGEIGDYIFCKPGDGEAKQAPCTQPWRSMRSRGRAAQLSVQFPKEKRSYEYLRLVG
jgi:hypothetical protein